MTQDTTHKTLTKSGAPPPSLEEQIRRRAYELYETCGREDGHRYGKSADFQYFYPSAILHHQPVFKHCSTNSPIRSPESLRRPITVQSTIAIDNHEQKTSIELERAPLVTLSDPLN